MKPIQVSQILDVLNNQQPSFIENLAQQARQITKQYFGNAIGLYTPLYLSNYCSSHCVYCGFHRQNKIKRIKLEPDEINTEMKAISALGTQNILLLTGESPEITPISYLLEATHLACQYFQEVSFEVYPMSTEDYHSLYLKGADGVTVYQETYDRKRYQEVHLAGQKKNYDFRREAPFRIAQSGIRHLSLGILLGLGPLAEDLCALYNHLRELEKAFPGIEYSLSFPRLRTIKSKVFSAQGIDDITFTKILSLTRLLFPRVGINLSTRETASFRNHALQIAVTKISIASKTTVGGYQEQKTDDPQFDIADGRSAEETISYLKQNNFDPVFTDWRKIANT